MANGIVAVTVLLYHPVVGGVTDFQAMGFIAFSPSYS